MSTMTLDPELTAMYTVLAEKFAALGPIDLPARGDVQALRT